MRSRQTTKRRFKDLTEKEKNIVYNGPAEKKHIFYHAKNSNQAGELDFTYYNAVYTVENALAKVKDEKGMKRVEKFLKQDICPDCGRFQALLRGALHLHETPYDPGGEGTGG